MTKKNKKSKSLTRFKSNLKMMPGEKSVDTVPLRQDLTEDFRETSPHDMTQDEDTAANWSQPEDRGEDLINETDPYTQQPELDTQIPPELIQKRAYYLYEQRIAASGSPDNLADWFEAERQLRGEMIGEVASHKKKTTAKP